MVSSDLRDTENAILVLCMAVLGSRALIAMSSTYPPTGRMHSCALSQVCAQVFPAFQHQQLQVNCEMNLYHQRRLNDVRMKSPILPCAWHTLHLSPECHNSQ